MSRRKVSAQDIVKMRKMRAANLSDLTISLDFEVSPSTVWHYTKDVPREPRGPQGPKRFEEMAADRLAGMRTCELAAKYGYQVSSVRKVLSRFSQAGGRA